MAMTMKEKASQSHVKTEWRAALKPEFAREAEKPNGCVGSGEAAPDAVGMSRSP